MVGKVKGLLEREGRFYARLVIPRELRPLLANRTELREPLGGDRREALRKHPRALANIQDRLEDARRRLAHASGLEVIRAARLSSPMSEEQMARRHYEERLSFDEELRGDHRYAQREIDTDLVADLRDAIAGKLSNDQLSELVGFAIEEARRRGNHDAGPGSEKWRKIARTLAVADLEALRRTAERDEGDFNGEPQAAFLNVVENEPEPAKASVSLKGLLDGYLKELAASGKGAEARKRWTPVFSQLVAFLKHDDANRLTKAKVIEWKDDLLTRLSPKTVRDSHIGSLKAVLNWAVDNAKLDLNPAQGVKVRLTARPQGRSKGFSDDEATAILKAISAYKPKPSVNPQTREDHRTTAAKRWVPWLCAFTGARVAEITQLRKEDVREEGGIAFIRITPEADSVKTGLYRDVPLHPQVVERGFLKFVENAEAGPLFFKPRTKVGKTHPAKFVSQNLAKWLRSLDVMPADVDPSHGWRHRLKTIGREIGADPRVIDAIQGHAPQTAGENYGDVTLKAKLAAVQQFPSYVIG